MKMRSRSHTRDVSVDSLIEVCEQVYHVQSYKLLR